MTQAVGTTGDTQLCCSTAYPVVMLTGVMQRGKQLHSGGGDNRVGLRYSGGASSYSSPWAIHAVTLMLARVLP